MSKSSYNPKIVTAFFASHGIPEPEYEYQFAADIQRRWRFDLAWFRGASAHMTDQEIPPLVALECDGGIWIGGGHNRGAQIKKTWEKENEAVCRGWAILKCEPKDLCTLQTVNLIKRALGLVAT